MGVVEVNSSLVVSKDPPNDIKLIIKHYGTKYNSLPNYTLILLYNNTTCKMFSKPPLYTHAGYLITANFKFIGHSAKQTGHTQALHLKELPLMHRLHTTDYIPIT